MEFIYVSNTYDCILATRKISATEIHNRRWGTVLSNWLNNFNTKQARRFSVTHLRRTNEISRTWEKIDLSHYGGLWLDKKWKYCEWIVMRYEILERISHFTMVSECKMSGELPWDCCVWDWHGSLLVVGCSPALITGHRRVRGQELGRGRGLSPSLDTRPGGNIKAEDGIW